MLKMPKFKEVLKQRLTNRKIKFSEFYNPKNLVEKTLLPEYGAVFVAQNHVKTAPKIVFANAAEVAEFQKSLSTAKAVIGGFELELQTPAMNDLLTSIKQAEKENLTITPRGADSARRDYAGTIELWASRVNPALTHWTANGRISVAEAENISSLTPSAQVAEVFRLEKQEIFFSKDLKKTIIYSVAPPGASQHLALLAFDVREYKNERVRQILAENRWFQTVVSDLPHFTYLGVEEEKLPNSGLKKVENENQMFWIPNM